VTICVSYHPASNPWAVQTAASVVAALTNTEVRDMPSRFCPPGHIYLWDPSVLETERIGPLLRPDVGLEVPWTT
jgi:hypothetical protein